MKVTLELDIIIIIIIIILKFHIRNTVVYVEPILIACHRRAYRDLPYFCMSVEKLPLIPCASPYRFETKTIVFHMNQRFFSAIFHFSSYNSLLVSSSQVSPVIKMWAKWRHF